MGISYSPRMLTLKEIVELRLGELGLGAVEAATAAGIERTYIRDIVEGKKKIWTFPMTIRRKSLASAATQ